MDQDESDIDWRLTSESKNINRGDRKNGAIRMVNVFQNIFESLKIVRMTLISRNIYFKTCEPKCK